MRDIPAIFADFPKEISLMKSELTDTKCRKAKPKEKPYKLTDRDGLFLLVQPNGRKFWRLRFKMHKGDVEKDGKPKLSDCLISLGRYPEIGLADAREEVIAQRKLIAKNINPTTVRQAERNMARHSFSAVADEFFKRGCPGGKGKKIKDVTRDQLRQRCDDYLIPAFGNTALGEISVEQVRGVLDSIIADGHIETAHRVRALAERIFRLGQSLGFTDTNPPLMLMRTIPPRDSDGFPAITDAGEIGGLLRSIDDYHGQPVIRLALQLLPHVFLRPGELRGGEWSEIDWDRREWIVPAERMKMNRKHIVPLSKQSISLLKELHKLTGDGALMFPGLRSKDRPISDNSLNAALRRLGYSKHEHTAHGFRKMASTRLHEMRNGDKTRFDSAVIETQLAHKSGNQVSQVYNFAEYLDLRRKMMQAWSDYLDDRKKNKKASVSRIRA